LLRIVDRVPAFPDRVTMRRAVPDDAEALTSLHLDVWEDAYVGLMPDRVVSERRATLSERIDRWRMNLASSPATTTVVEAETRLIGFASIGPGRDEDVAIAEEVWALYVRSAWWGHGVGHALLTATLADRPASLWVLDGNARAMAFYRRHGFVADGTVRTDGHGTELRMVR
jgi:GNAT superfamily N-acetyltransferase